MEDDKKNGTSPVFRNFETIEKKQNVTGSQAVSTGCITDRFIFMYSWNFAKSKFKKMLGKPDPFTMQTFSIIYTVKKSGLFFYTYYAKNNPDVIKANMDVLLHYLLYGGKEKRNPNPLFDSSWYLYQYNDVLQSGMNPLYHYIRFGASEGRDPSPNFSTIGYFEANTDVKKAGTNPLIHYFKFGIFEGRALR